MNYSIVILLSPIYAPFACSNFNIMQSQYLYTLYTLLYGSKGTQIFMNPTLERQGKLEANFNVLDHLAKFPWKTNERQCSLGVQC